LFSVTSVSSARSPIVVDGFVYACTRGSILYAFNAYNGEQVWNYNTAGSLAAANGVLYVGASSSATGMLAPTSGIIALGVPSTPSPSLSPTPTHTPTVTPTPTQTPTPSPSIPEFSVWLFLLTVLVVIALVTAVLVKGKDKFCRFKLS
jgi:hypothetical protein